MLRLPGIYNAETTYYRGEVIRLATANELMNTINFKVTEVIL